MSRALLVAAEDTRIGTGVVFGFTGTVARGRGAPQLPVHPRDRDQIDARRRGLDIELGRREIEVALQHVRRIQTVTNKCLVDELPRDAGCSSHVVDGAEPATSKSVETEVIGAKEREGIERIDG